MLSTAEWTWSLMPACTPLLNFGLSPQVEKCAPCTRSPQGFGVQCEAIRTMRLPERLARLFGTVQDVTETKRAEEAHHALSRDLQESKAWLEEAQRVAHLGYWVWDLETNQVIWSEETYRIFGLTPQVGSMDIAIVGEMFHPDDREAVFRTSRRGYPFWDAG